MRDASQDVTQDLIDEMMLIADTDQSGTISEE